MKKVEERGNWRNEDSVNEDSVNEDSVNEDSVNEDSVNEDREGSGRAWEPCSRPGSGVQTVESTVEPGAKRRGQRGVKRLIGDEVVQKNLRIFLQERYDEIDDHRGPACRCRLMTYERALMNAPFPQLKFTIVIGTDIITNASKV
ncbi:hypothetical protein K457DRAFT_1821854 [Linnemannia elongata AG-77]|uniref:Uncharacterized protein n=1 Tax=Linnemannia elongata AG-77 TaxID=1314771 RepID=A0A197JNI0_9FUNG|nr:hypothetical protein K457DRAFT_1821854 [Linnemannia elongata AG-77]